MCNAYRKEFQCAPLFLRRDDAIAAASQAGKKKLVPRADHCGGRGDFSRIFSALRVKPGHKTCLRVNKMRSLFAVCSAKLGNRPALRRNDILFDTLRALPPRSSVRPSSDTRDNSRIRRLKLFFFEGGGESRKSHKLNVIFAVLIQFNYEFFAATFLLYSCQFLFLLCLSPQKKKGERKGLRLIVRPLSGSGRRFGSLYDWTRRCALCPFGI